MLPDAQIAHAPLLTRYGRFTFGVFSWSENEQDNVLTLSSPIQRGATPLVRIQSACYSGEIFESLDCDCHWQLETSLKLIQEEGGLFIYMLRDGRGAGVLAKIRGLDLSSRLGLDTADAYKSLGIDPDPREYQQVDYILAHYKFRSLRLLTNNPRKIAALVDRRFGVKRMPLESVPTHTNRDYLQCKALKLGHMMKVFGTGPVN